MLTTQFFAMKIQRYMADHGISESTLAKVAAKAFANGARNPNAWRRKPLYRGGDPGLPDGQPPADAVHVLLAGRRRRGAGARRGRPTPNAVPRTPVYLRSVAFRTRRFGSFEVFSPSIPLESAPSPTADAAAAAFEQAGIGPDGRRRRPAPGHRVRRRGHAPGRDRAVRARRAGGADPARRDARSAGACRSTPTAAAWPTASRSAPRGCARCTRWCCNCAAKPGDRQVPGRAAVGFTQVYGAPGVSACAVLTL